MRRTMEVFFLKIIWSYFSYFFGKWFCMAAAVMPGIVLERGVLHKNINTRGELNDIW